MERGYSGHRVSKGWSFVAAAVAVLLAVSGCGASGHAQSSSSSPSSDSTAAAELIAGADAICKRFDAQLAAATPAHLDMRAIARSAPGNAALERIAVSELARLTAPPSLARDWSQIIAYRRTLANELARVGRYAKAGDVGAVAALGASKKRVHDLLFKLASRDGFRYCSQVTTTRASGTAGGVGKTGGAGKAA